MPKWINKSMLDLIQNLTKREIIIYFFTKYTKNRLNKNCNDRKFFSRRNFGFVYDYIEMYFEEYPELNNSSITRKYYHILNWDEDYHASENFINFREGYKNLSKNKNNKINYESVMGMRIPFPYKKEFVLKILKEDKDNGNSLRNKNNLLKFKDKMLLYSIFYYTQEFKKINLNCRISILLNENVKTDFLCPVCNEERTYSYNNLSIVCENKNCLKTLQSNNAKKRGIWMMHTKEAKENRANSLRGKKISQEHKRKIGESNAKKWTSEFRDKIKLMRIEKNLSKRQSDTMKNKILNGEFTPKSENRKRSKRLKSDVTGLSYRSNWELIFHERYPHLQYEKIRIKYNEDGKERIYITDFVDLEKNIIYEIKPSSELNDSNFLIKKEYTDEWCRKNNYIYKVITEKDCNFYERNKF